jgi:hypothetical protein
MIALQTTPLRWPLPIWSRAAIHDSVATIARQPMYRRDTGTSLLDRLINWFTEGFTRLVQALGGVPHGRILATLAAGAVALLVVARVVYAARLRAPAAIGPDGTRGRVSASADPWRDAERLAESERYTEAAHALYRAVLITLASRRLVRLHESKTSGDYARELRRRGAPEYATFRQFGIRYDRIVYGTGECGPAEYAALLKDARSLTPVAERAA